MLRIVPGTRTGLTNLPLNQRFRGVSAVSPNRGDRCDARPFSRTAKNELSQGRVALRLRGLRKLSCNTQRVTMLRRPPALPGYLSHLK